MTKLLIPLPIVALLSALWIVSASPNVEQPTPEPTLTPKILPLPEKEFETSPWIVEEDTCVGFALFLSFPPKCFNGEGDVVPAWTQRPIIMTSR